MKQISPEAFDPTLLDGEPVFEDETSEEDDELWFAQTEVKTVLEVPGFT